MAGTIHSEGTHSRDTFGSQTVGWQTLPQLWTAAMEATVFTGWIYDFRAARRRAESGASVDAAGHCGGKKEE